MNGFAVTQLRRFFLWSAIYMAMIFVLGQADYLGRPLINFASYFYLLAMIGVPVTLFFPAVTRVATAVPMAVWGGFYIALSLFINRSLTIIRSRASSRSTAA